MRNEANWLARCLDSLKGFDEIVVVDTGSTDNTVEIANKYTDKVFTDFTWCDDFSKARNHAISKCTGDWIMMIDADNKFCNTIDELKEQIKIAEEKGLRTLSFKLLDEKSGFNHRLPMCWKNDPDIFFKGAAHNYLTLSEHNNVDLTISYQYSDTHQKDPDRTFRILKKYVAENPDCKRERFYLAREYWYRQDYITAVYHYEEYLRIADWGAEIAEADLMLARCYWQLQKGDTARNYCAAAITLSTNFREAILFMAEMSGPVNRKRWEQFARGADNQGILFTRIPAGEDVIS